MLVSVRSFVALVFGLAACASASGQSLVPAARAGGGIAQPVAVGDYLYVPAGVGIEVWNLADPAHPAHVGRTASDDEAPGRISDLTAVAGHLYASWWHSGYGASIYSLADKAHPALVGDIDGGYAQRLGTDGTHLFLAGTNIGLLSYDLADPDHPVQIGISDTFLFGDVVGFSVDGDRIALGTMSMGGEWLSWFVDVSDPAHLHAAASNTGCRAECIVDGDYVISFSAGFYVLDAHDPSNPVLISSNPGTATHGVVDGDVLWTFGDDVESWDVSDPAHPAPLGDAAIDVLGTTYAALTPRGPLAIDAGGSGTLIGGSTAASPRVLARIEVPGGGVIESGTLDARYAYLADPAFGLRIVSSPNLTPVGAIAIGEGELRGAHDVALQDSIAYVIGWDALHAIAVSDPRHPVELGSVSMPFFHRIEVDGDRAYLTMINQLTTLTIVDITDPAHMQTRGSMGYEPLVNPRGLVARGDRAYVATEGGYPTGGGLRVINVSDPDMPVEIGDGVSCGTNDFATSIAFVGNTTDELALGCYNGTVHLLDIGDPATPVELGAFTLAAAFPNVGSLAVSGNTLYAGHFDGVDKYDITNRAAPVWIASDATADDVRNASVSGNALIAITESAGTYSYAIPSTVAARPGHSHHARPVRSFEP